MIDANELQKYLNAASADADFLKTCVSTASSMVNELIAGAEVPETVKDQAILEVGANLYQRRTSRRDIDNFGATNVVTPLSRPALDPLTPARPILRPYLGIGISG